MPDGTQIDRWPRRKRFRKSPKPGGTSEQDAFEKYHRMFIANKFARLTNADPSDRDKWIKILPNDYKSIPGIHHFVRSINLVYVVRKKHTEFGRLIIDFSMKKLLMNLGSNSRISSGRRRVMFLCTMSRFISKVRAQLCDALSKRELRALELAAAGLSIPTQSRRDCDLGNTSRVLIHIEAVDHGDVIIIATIDIRKAYLQFLIREDARDHLGYLFQPSHGTPQFAQMNVAMFGLASSGYIACTMMWTILEMFLQGHPEYTPYMTIFVDDVIFVGPRRFVTPAYDDFSHWLEYVGFNVGDCQRPGRDITADPNSNPHTDSTCGEGLGWELDTQANNGFGSMRLSGWKLTNLREIFDKISMCKPKAPISLSLDELSSVIGRGIHLRVYGSTPMPSTLHLQKVERAWRSQSKKNGLIYHNQVGFRQLKALKKIMLEPIPIVTELGIGLGDRLLAYTDSCDTCAGGHEPGFERMWFAYRDEINIKMLIHFGEGTSVIMGLMQAMGHRTHKTNRKHMLVYNDNENVVITINKGRAGKPSLEPWSNLLFSLCRRYNISISAIWLGSGTNEISDFASRIIKSKEHALKDKAIKLANTASLDTQPHLFLSHSPGTDPSSSDQYAARLVEIRFIDKLDMGPIGGPRLAPPPLHVTPPPVTNTCRWDRARNRALPMSLKRFLFQLKRFS